MISLVILKRDTTGVMIRLKGFRFEKSKMKSILTVGLPTAIGGSTMQLGFLLMSRNVYVYGTGAMAAYGIGNKVNGLITLPSNGIGSAVATIVGQNIGANQIDRAEKGYKIARRVSVIFLFVVCDFVCGIPHGALEEKARVIILILRKGRIIG